MTRNNFFACRSNSILNCLRNVTLMMFIKAFDHGNVRGPTVYFRNRRKRKLTADLCPCWDFSHQIFSRVNFFIADTIFRRVMSTQRNLTKYLSGNLAQIRWHKSVGANLIEVRENPYYASLVSSSIISVILVLLVL